jgi:hypothetical protein
MGLSARKEIVDCSTSTHPLLCIDEKRAPLTASLGSCVHQLLFSIGRFTVLLRHFFEAPKNWQTVNGFGRQRSLSP